MAATFNRTGPDGQPRCSFYDSDLLPHGGPSPDRKRRDVSKSDGFDEIMAMLLGDSTGFERGRNGSDRYDRENPLKGAKQITTGFRKWAERYISDCYGQKTFQHHVKRFPKIFGRLKGALKEEAGDAQYAEWEMAI